MKKDVKRLLDELRLLGPAGLQRAAEAWRANSGGEDKLRSTAGKREEDDAEWREAEEGIFLLAGGESWLAASQVDRESAVAAAQDALLAVMERGTLSRADYQRLAGPMAESLPWLLSGEAEDRY
ncbi:MAG TPA: hypothetical protein VNG93_09335 [Candidatus Dormibacteraeota bacterium]|nr:hypothetical protein [Candidatus Dormibacteraeota bacterium]